MVQRVTKVGYYRVALWFPIAITVVTLGIVEAERMSGLMSEHARPLLDWSAIIAFVGRIGAIPYLFTLAIVLFLARKTSNSALFYAAALFIGPMVAAIALVLYSWTRLVIQGEATLYGGALIFAFVWALIIGYSYSAAVGLIGAIFQRLGWLKA